MAPRTIICISCGISCLYFFSDRVQDKVLMPGTAFFDIAAAARATLVGVTQNTTLMLSNLAIICPKILSIDLRAGDSLECCVDTHTKSWLHRQVTPDHVFDTPRKADEQARTPLLLNIYPHPPTLPHS
jgi:hypothetical protein